MNSAQLQYDITLGTPYLPDFMYLPHGPLQTLICDQKWEIIWRFWKCVFVRVCLCVIKGVGQEMLPAGPYPIHFSMLSPKMMSVLVHEQALGKPAHFYGPKKRYFCRFFLFLLFWTISTTRIGLLIWLWAYFKAETLGHTSHPNAGLCVPFWVH
jgi:hypothetical protein